MAKTVRTTSSGSQGSGRARSSKYSKGRPGDWRDRRSRRARMHPGAQRAACWRRAGARGHGSGARARHGPSSGPVRQRAQRARRHRDAAARPSGRSGPVRAGSEREARIAPIGSGDGGNTLRIAGEADGPGETLDGALPGQFREALFAARSRPRPRRARPGPRGWRRRVRRRSPLATPVLARFPSLLPFAPTLCLAAPPLDVHSAAGRATMAVRAF